MYLSLALWFISIFLEYYIYKKLTQAGISLFARNLFMCWAVICFYEFLYAGLIAKLFDSRRLGEILGGLGITWIIIVLLAFLAFMIVNILTGFKPFTKNKVSCAVILAFMGVIYCLCEAYFVQERNIIIKTRKLPENINKIRITYLTDLHLGGIYTTAHFNRVMKIVEDSSPDIFILCGDIFDGDMSYWTEEISRLSKAAKRAPLGAFAVNGNHEIAHWYTDDYDTLARESGFNLLNDERAETAGLVILGIDDRENKFYSWLNFLLKPEDSNKFVLIIKHRPYLAQDSQGNFDLQLSGHTHGGQYWPLRYFKTWQEGGIPQGLSQQAGGLVYVSNGAGYNGPCMRLFAPPEVTVIDLVRE